MGNRCTLNYRTVQRRVTIVQDGNFVSIEDRGHKIAEFALVDMWDFICDALKEAHPNTEGLARRVYEARNLYRLSQEFLETNEEVV